MQSTFPPTIIISIIAGLVVSQMVPDPWIGFRNGFLIFFGLGVLKLTLRTLLQSSKSR